MKRKSFFAQNLLGLEVHHKMGGKGTGGAVIPGLVWQIKQEMGENSTRACPLDTRPSLSDRGRCHTCCAHLQLVFS